jgi:outer membrane protein assembly factor BamB
MVIGSKVSIANEKEIKSTVSRDGGLMDSAWPMYCHDTRHTGRSPYSTADSCTEKWRFEAECWIIGGIAIDNDGTIYFGDYCYYVYAINPDGTEKWRYKTGGEIWATPAIAEDGTIYIGSWDDYLYAINPDGTLKWCFLTYDDILSSCAIGTDGTIYFGAMGPENNGSIYALYPDGTEKWHYDTGHWVFSSPAIGSNGTIYIGSSDCYLYALWPNGTLRWRFLTGDEIRAHPSIADDGTIYIGSYDHYLYAINPDGTEKWKFNSAGGNNCPTIDEDGTVYVATDYLYALNLNGSVKWNFDFGTDIWVGKSSPAISADGIIYVGTHIGIGEGGEIIAVNSDGTERWRKLITGTILGWVDSSPAIGEDGTVYIGSIACYLHAFGPQESNDPPSAPTITGSFIGKIGRYYDYDFVANDPDRNPVSYFVSWGDGTVSGWTSDYNTDEVISLRHSWNRTGTFTIIAKARDTFGAEGPEAELTVTMPRNRAINGFFLRLLEKFPILQTLLQRLF